MSLNKEGKNELYLIAAVFGAWADYRDIRQPSPPVQIARILDQYYVPPSVEVKRKVAKLSSGRAGAKIGTGPLGYFRLPAVRNFGADLYPVCRLEVDLKEGVICVSLRLAVYSDESSGRVRARGWRYESGDTGKSDGHRFHHFPHVQSITSWSRDEAGIEPPGNMQLDLIYDDGVHESRPAFPLRCTNPHGILIAAMGSLYGANRTREILESSGTNSLALEAAHVLCDA